MSRPRPHPEASSVQCDEDVTCCYRRVNRSGLRVVWEITSACNLSCSHCFRTTGDEDELTSREAERLIDTFPDLGVTKVAFTGGEPLMRSDLLDLIEHVRSHGMLVKLLTNGTLVTTEIAAALGSLAPLEVNVSLDGATAATRDRRRGAGSFAKLMTALKLLSAYPLIQVNGVAVLNRASLVEIPSIAKLADQLGFASMTFSDMFAPRNGKLERSCDALSREEWAAALAEIRSLHGHRRSCRIRSVGLASDPTDPCEAAASIVQLDPFGYANARTMRLSHLGRNVREAELSEILLALREESSGVSCECVSQA